MEKVVLKRSGKPGLEFEGELLYEGETSPDQASDRWSGAVGRWEEVRVYRTKGGKYVVWIARYTQWQGERDIFIAEVFASPEEAMRYLEDEEPWAAEEVAEELGVTERLE